MMRSILLALALTASLGAQTEAYRFVVIPNAADSAVGELRFREKRANGANYVGFKAPASIAANGIWEIWAADGAAGDCVKTNGSKVLYFDPCGGGAGTFPVVDTTTLVKGSGDATKLFRLEVDGLTTATTRVCTVPDADFTF